MDTGCNMQTKLLIICFLILGVLLCIALAGALDMVSAAPMTPMRATFTPRPEVTPAPTYAPPPTPTEAPYPAPDEPSHRAPRVPNGLECKQCSVWW